MGRFCTWCGRELEEGEVCRCTMEDEKKTDRETGAEVPVMEEGSIRTEPAERSEAGPIPEQGQEDGTFQHFRADATDATGESEPDGQEPEVPKPGTPGASQEDPVPENLHWSI